MQLSIYCMHNIERRYLQGAACSAQADTATSNVQHGKNRGEKSS